MEVKIEKAPKGRKNKAKGNALGKIGKKEAVHPKMLQWNGNHTCTAI